MKRISNWWEVESYHQGGHSYMSRWRLRNNRHIIVELIFDHKLQHPHKTHIFTRADFKSWGPIVYLGKVHDIKSIYILNKEAINLLKEYETNK